MLIQILQQVFKRDLQKLKLEIEQYQNENALWLIEESITNSAGNLCLHLIGNLNHFIGNVIGNTGYVRQRDLEFSQRYIPKKELLAMIDATLLMVDDVLKNMPIESLEKEYPRQVFETKTTTQYFLIHLTTHLSYHLGQINYHRRLLDT